jgi:hypothetical protein
MPKLYRQAGVGRGVKTPGLICRPGVIALSALAAILLAGVLFGVAAWPNGARARTSGPAVHPGGGADGRPAWLLSGATLARIGRLDLPLARFWFDSPRTYVIARTTLARRLAPAALPAVSFANETRLAAAIEHRRLRAGTRAVIFDDEHGAQTPAIQQRQFARYYRLAGEVAHRHGLALIATPASDLVAELAPQTPPGRRYAEFLRLGIAAAAARYANVYEVQAQGAELAPSAYARFVRVAAAQARRAHPGVEVLAGLSTNASGRRAQPAQLLDSARAVLDMVSGFWLNDPARGPACPRCTGPYPQVAIGFLRELRQALLPTGGRPAPAKSSRRPRAR